MVIFHSFLYVYQRVSLLGLYYTFFRPGPPQRAFPRPLRLGRSDAMGGGGPVDSESKGLHVGEESFSPISLGFMIQK